MSQALKMINQFPLKLCNLFQDFPHHRSVSEYCASASCVLVLRFSQHVISTISPVLVFTTTDWIQKYTFPAFYLLQGTLGMCTASDNNFMCQLLSNFPLGRNIIWFTINLVKILTKVFVIHKLYRNSHLNFS